MRVSISPECLKIILDVLDDNDNLSPDSYEWGRLKETYYYLEDKLEKSGYDQ